MQAISTCSLPNKIRDEEGYQVDKLQVGLLCSSTHHHPPYNRKTYM